MASDVPLELVLPLSRPDRELELVERARQGEHDAYARLVRPYERIAYRVSVAITGRGDDAEEAMQNGFVKAYRSLDRFHFGAPFKPWLLRIVVNEAHNVVRDRRRHIGLGKRATLQHDAPPAGADEALLAREDAKTVLAAVAHLPRLDRVAIALRYFAELPDRDAAALIGVSVDAYRVRLVRARRRLQRMLEESDV